jgi:hypothetical protein
VLDRPRPRVRVRPKGVASGTDADDAIFLAASYGLIPDEWQEDAVDDWLLRGRKGIWLASTCGLAVPRQNGKNAIIEIRELYGLVILGEKFLHTAHEVKTARKAFKRLKYFFGEQANDPNAKFPELNALVREIRSTNGQEAVVLHAVDCRTRTETDGRCNCTDGPSVEFVARSKGSGRGFTVDVLVCDEAQDLTDEELEALLPTISAAPLRNPQIIFTGTPPNPEKNQTGEVFTRVRKDADDGTDPHLAFTDYGVPDGPLDQIDLDNLDVLYDTNPALAVGRLQLEVCRTERRRMSSAGYARERLGWWGNLSGGENVEGAFPGWVAAGSASRLPPEHVQAIGLSVALNREWSSIGSAGFTDDDQTFIAAVRHDVGTQWLVDEALRIQEEHGCAVAINGAGPGKNLIPALEDAGVDLVILDEGQACDAYADLRDGIKNKTHVHGCSEELDDAVKVTAERKLGRRLALDQLVGKDGSMAEAAMIAGWAANHDGGGAPTAYGGNLELCDSCGVKPHEDPDGVHNYLCSDCREDAT